MKEKPKGKAKLKSEDMRMPEDEFDRIMRGALQVPPETKPEQERPKTLKKGR